MEKCTRDFIYALKRRIDCNIQKIAIDFMSEYTGTPREYYYPGILLRIARQKFLDYISTADHPQSIVREFFEIKDRHESIDESEALLIALSLVQVKGTNGEYVNGFWDDLCVKNNYEE